MCVSTSHQIKAKSNTEELNANALWHVFIRVGMFLQQLTVIETGRSQLHASTLMPGRIVDHINQLQGVCYTAMTRPKLAKTAFCSLY